MTLAVFPSIQFLVQKGHLHLCELRAQTWSLSSALCQHQIVPLQTRENQNALRLHCMWTLVNCHYSSVCLPQCPGCNCAFCISHDERRCPWETLEIVSLPIRSRCFIYHRTPLYIECSRETWSDGGEVLVACRLKDSSMCLGLR